MIWQFGEESTPITFANKTTNYQKNTLKLAVTVQNWPFYNLVNKLSIVMVSGSANGESVCTQSTQSDENGSLQWALLVIGSSSLYLDTRKLKKERKLMGTKICSIRRQSCFGWQDSNNIIRVRCNEQYDNCHFTSFLVQCRYLPLPFHPFLLFLLSSRHFFYKPYLQTWTQTSACFWASRHNTTSAGIRFRVQKERQARQSLQSWFR
jgi:hypothetical protein